MLSDLPEFVFEAHNAAEDVRVVCAILTATKITSDLLLSASESLPSYEARQAFQEESKMRQASFHAAVRAKAISKGMAKKAADSGHSFMHVRLAFRRGGADGVIGLFGDKQKGRPRVTNRRQIAQSISDYCTSLDQ